MKRTLWVERTFQFDFPEGWIFNIIERLRGADARLRNITSAISDHDAANSIGSKWSIKEEIGHLVDLEDLHINRLKEFQDKQEVLSAADMSNAKTYASNHNEKTITELIDAFSRKRNQLVSLLEHMDDEIQLHRALHPRLQVFMRPVDVAYFTAEHDDHHIASIRELV